MPVTPEPSRTILVTGATDGIGLETARQLAAMGHHVVLHGRRQDRLDAALAVLPRGARADTVLGDFASLASVRAMADTVRARGLVLDVLVNNAGIYMNDARLTTDGFEMTFGVNHLAPFLLTHLLLPALSPTHARVINVSSVAHGRGRLDPRTWRSLDGFSPYGAYAQSKLANVLMTVELARRLPDHVDTFSLHPGVVSTKLLTEGFGMRGADSLGDGADTSVWLATAPDLHSLDGRYVVRRRESAMNRLAADERVTADFYRESASMTDVTPLNAPG